MTTAFANRRYDAVSDTHIDLETFKTLLLQQRDALLSVVESGEDAAKPVELDQTRVGRVSRMDAMQQQAMAQESDRRRTLELQRIRAALERIEAGDYGYCLSCDEPIAPQRLRVDPAAMQCIGCASRAER